MKKILYLLSTAFLLSAVLLSSCSEPVIPQGYALIYGVTDYYPFPALSWTDDDAEDLAALLYSKGWIVKLGLNEDADLASVTADVENLAGTITVNDRFLFYFSGHGGYLNLSGGEPNQAENTADEFIALHGADSVIASFMSGNTNADVLSVTLSDDSLSDLLSQLPVKTKTVIIDACNSGGFIGDGFTYNAIPQDYVKNEPSAVFTPAETFNMYINYAPSGNDLPNTDYTVITASGELENSWENSAIGHGIFTYYLLLSPGNADFNLDGYISLIEAWKFTALSIDKYFNISEGDNINTDQHYMPNLSAFPVDPILFKAD